MADMLKFRKGTLAQINSASKVAGTIYIAKDEKAMYVDISASERIRIGDFVRVATVNDIPFPASTTALYYVEANNALLGYDGENWKQINGTEDLEKAIGENADAIEALDERLTALDKTDGRVASIENRVTAIDAATTGRMAVAEADIEALKAAIGMGEDGEVEGLDGRVTSLEGRMGTAESDIEALEEKDGQLEEAIEGVKGLLTQHETTAGQTYATKAELTAAKSAVLGQTDGVDYNGTVKGAYELVKAEEDRAKGVEAENAAAAAAAAEAAATADAKAVQAGKDAAAADKKAVDANANAETRLLITDFQAFEITNTAAIQGADNKAKAAGEAAAAIQEEFDAYELTHSYTDTKINELVADAKKAGTDANDNANTRLTIADFNTFKNGYDSTINGINEDIGAAQGDATEALTKLAALESGDNSVSKQIENAVKEVKEYADQAETDAINSAKGYTDAEVKKVQDNLDDTNEALGEANEQIDLNKQAIEKLNGTGDGSVAKAVSDAEGRAAADATSKANSALADAKTYVGQQLEPINQSISDIEDAIETNAEAIELLNAADTVEGSVDYKIKGAKAALTEELNSKINAANAMVYKGEVSSATELAGLTDLSVGDTYVVSSSFGNYRAGDLLVARGDETDNIITSNFTWDHVTTGYDASLEQTITTVDGKIQLTSAVGTGDEANNGQISFVAETGSSAKVSVANNTVTIGMMWDDFPTT